MDTIMRQCSAAGRPSSAPLPYGTPASSPRIHSGSSAGAVGGVSPRGSLFLIAKQEAMVKRGGDEQMAQRHSLTINANDRCAIDAGSWQECIEEDQMPYRLISSPQTTMYRQVLSYLEETTRDEKVPPKSQLHFGEVAIATVAICIRWGAYFAVLVNRDLPQWTAAVDPNVSCIGDGEM